MGKSSVHPGSVRSATRMCPCRLPAADGSRTTRTGARTTPGQTRLVVDVDGVAAMGNVAFSSLIEADVQIVADRTMTWDAAGFGWEVGTPRFDWQRLKANRAREITRLNGVYAGLLQSCQNLDEALRVALGLEAGTVPDPDDEGLHRIVVSLEPRLDLGIAFAHPV